MFGLLLDLFAVSPKKAAVTPDLRAFLGIACGQRSCFFVSSNQ
jgi:hypothetical protein